MMRNRCSAAQQKQPALFGPVVNPDVVSAW